jgi:uncharacterized membrane protein YoaK (UPF0700 family)
MDGMVTDGKALDNKATTDQPGRFLLTTLIILTAVSGLIDAVSYLGLGHVFTANMTGNVVLLGFAAAGASGFSATCCLTSLCAFLVGGVAAGRAARMLASRRRLLVLAMSAEGVASGTAAIVAFATTTVPVGWPRYTAIAVLAAGLGVRNATIRKLAVSDLPTTVLTMTLTGLTSDSALAGGTNPNAARRGGAVLAMLIGAFAGALAFRHAGAGPTLLIGSVVVIVNGLAFWLARESRRLDQATIGKSAPAP